MSLVAVYKLESDGTDYSGNGYNLTVSGTPTFVRGKFANAMSADGVATDDCYSGLYSPSGVVSRTYSAWATIAASSTTYAYPGIFCESNSTDKSKSWIAYFQPWNNFLFARIPNGGTQCTARNSMITPVVNTWYHVVGVWDSVSGTHQCYVNGVAGTPSTGVASGSVATIQKVTLGGQHTVTTGVSVNFTWNGLLDEVFIENRAWSAQDVRRYYNQARGRFAPSIS